MVVTDPRTSEKRRAREAAIRVIDLVIYFAAISGGVSALLVTPESVTEALRGWEWLTTGWGLLLIISGSFGFIGRLSRVWLIEIPAPFASMCGGLIYLVILGSSAPTRPTAWVAVSLVFIATAALFRRFIELQIFTTDPNVQSLTDRIQAAIRRRTANTVPHK